jgi:multiple sugar transport system substrate-binding protein/putative aldouronate transport system substrate-binding protein
MTNSAVPQISRRGFIGGIAGAVVLAGLTGCTFGGKSASTAKGAAFGGPYKTDLKIDVFDGLANFQGTQAGWFGDIVKKDFKLELNIIAPNVSGQGDTLYNTRVAAGNLGDLIVTDRGQKFDELVQGGLLYDFSDLYDKMTNIKGYDEAVQYLNKGKKGVYGVPTQITKLKPTTPGEGVDPTFGPFLRWDYYKELGYPEIGTLEDLIPVLKDMQAAHPKSDDGKQTYGFSLFKDWDGNMMNAGKQPACFYGYDEMGFVLAKADGSSYESIIDSDSHYVRSLKLYCSANQQGLVDPDSATQNYDALFTKYKNGQVLFSWWPWLGQSAYNTTDHLQAGKGFEIVPMKDMQIFSYGAAVYGNTQIFAIGSKAAEPGRIAAFLDWLYSPEGITDSGAQTMSAPGPKGLTWDIKDGKPELTDFGKKALLGDPAAATVPADFGGGSFKDGVSALNATTVLPVDIDPETKVQYNYLYWDSYIAQNTNPLLSDWRAKMGDAPNTMEYLQKNKQVLVAPGSGYAAPADSSEVQTIRNQAKAAIVQYSWKMSLAKSDNDFNKLLKEMQSTVNGLGYKKVLDVDMDNAKAQDAARKAVVKKFG